MHGLELATYLLPIHKIVGVIMELPAAVIAFDSQRDAECLKIASVLLAFRTASGQSNQRDAELKHQQRRPMPRVDDRATEAINLCRRDEVDALEPHCHSLGNRLPTSRDHDAIRHVCEGVEKLVAVLVGRANFVEQRLFSIRGAPFRGRLKRLDRC